MPLPGFGNCSCLHCIGHGGDARTAFQHDRWLRNTLWHASICFPALFSYCKRLNITVRKRCKPWSSVDEHGDATLQAIPFIYHSGCSGTGTSGRGGIPSPLTHWWNCWYHFLECVNRMLHDRKPMEANWHQGRKRITSHWARGRKGRRSR